MQRGVLLHFGCIRLRFGQGCGQTLFDSVGGEPRVSGRNGHRGFGHNSRELDHAQGSHSLRCSRWLGLKDDKASNPQRLFEVAHARNSLFHNHCSRRWLLLHSFGTQLKSSRFAEKEWRVPCLQQTSCQCQGLAGNGNSLVALHSFACRSPHTRQRRWCNFGPRSKTKSGVSKIWFAFSDLGSHANQSICIEFDRKPL